MATHLEAPIGATERIRPLRRAEYDRLVDAGCFQDERIELIRGFLVEMSPQNAPHAGAIERLNVKLQTGLGGRAHVRVQLPLAVSDDSEPEPDLAVIAPRQDMSHHPASALLVIEVAGSSLARDLQVKAELYAAAHVPEYWVVDLAEGAVIVHTSPAGGRYGTIVTHRRGEVITPVGFPDFAITVEEIVG